MYTHTHAHSHRLPLFQLWPCISLSTSGLAARWTNHNICHKAVTTGLTLRPDQSVHIKLTGFSCGAGMSIHECTSQSYFTWSMEGLTTTQQHPSLLPRSFLPLPFPFFLPFQSLGQTAWGTLNESNELFTQETLTHTLWMVNVHEYVRIEVNHKNLFSHGGSSLE